MTDTKRVGEAAFNEAYTSLNAAQKQAVDTIEGPVMVIAGPGTGKTQVLTLRIANILLQTDTAPEQILALTFTEAGAKAMRERLHRYIGSAAYRVPIFTFHGFAGGLIAQFPESYQNVIGGIPASEIDKIRIFESILDNPELRIIRTPKSPYHNLGKIRNILSKLKQEYVTPDSLAEIVNKQIEALNKIEQFHAKGAHKGKERKEYRDAAKGVEKNQELLSVYRQYDSALHEQGLFDFDDMLVETVSALKADESMRLEVQETYQYVLADEHQDVNGVQNELLNTVVSYHESPNIFAVGDEKQAIYRFQGASLENFLHFSTLHKNCQKISLTKNYRSVQRILDIAHDLIKVEEGPLLELRVPLDSQVKGPSLVEKRIFSHQAVEDDWVVAQVQKELDTGIPAAEIAVLVRHNYSVEQLATKLRHAGISVSASAESDILTHPTTEAMINLLTVVAEPHNDQAWFKLLHAPYSHIPLEDLALLMQKRSFRQPLSKLVASEISAPTLELSNREALKIICQTVLHARDATLEEGPHRTLERVIIESGLLSYTVKSDPENSTRVIRRFYDEIEQLVVSKEVKNISDVIRVLKTYQEYNLSLNAPFINASDEAVSVMSVHKSKGLEYTTVILPRLNDKVWGGGRNSRYFDIPLSHYELETPQESLDDEQRLLYVALTRAKQRLYMSYAETNQEGAALLQSRLLDRISDTAVETISTDEQEENFDPLKSFGLGLDRRALDIDVLSGLFKEKGFSATSINNYLASPFIYLYQNLLQIPQLQSTPLQFGSVVHDVLEHVVRLYLTDTTRPNATQLKAWIENALDRLPLSESEYTAMHAQALEALVGYLEETFTSWPKEMQVEKKIEVMLPTGIKNCPEIRLTGKLDRIDFNSEGNAVGILDYKTGKPKSRNDIEGNTKNSDGNYKRQLVFYALLLDLYEDERLKTREMVLSFVEPNITGKFKEERFTITDEEVAELKVKIISAAKNILSGDAWQVPCNPDKCDYCNLIETQV